MADSDHLEKMGRELKCPICLSLLNSAVSLTCNHMFCNMCISKSMKSGSNCPVCKVPYLRREVRPAPHMDNLVNIYKSMEVASGTNIFITQTAPLTKTLDGQTQDDQKNSARPEYGKISGGKSKKQRLLKCKRLKGLENIETRDSDSQPSVKPSFPTKKRIQVPLHPLNETSGQRVSQSGNQSIVGGVERELNKVLENKCEKGSSFVHKEKPAFAEKEDPRFLPFFWLREQDDNDEGMDKLSAQQVEADRVTDTPQHNVPTFSDIKDSDDDSPIKLTPTGELRHKTEVASVFDSEMFEWTQRACSPELCSTPIKKPTKYKRSFHGIQKKEFEAASQVGTILRSEKTSLSESTRISNAKQGNENMHMVASVMEYQQTENGKVQNARKKTNKPNTKIQRKRIKRIIDKVDGMTTDKVLKEVSIDCDKIAENSNKENECPENDQILNSGIQEFQENHVKRLMTQTNVTDTGKILKATTNFRARTQDRRNGSMDLELPVSSCQQATNDRNPVAGNKNSKRCTKINTRFKRKSVTRSINKIVRIATAEVLEEAPHIYGKEENSQNRRNEKNDTGVPSLSSQQIEEGKNLDSVNKTRKRCKKINAQVERNCGKESKEQKRLKRFTDDIAKDGEEEVLYSCKSTDKKHYSKTEQENLESGEHYTKTQKVLFTKDNFLQKCENSSNSIRCVFCQSSDDSEASGEMIHYFKGKSVSADYNGGSKVIHSHRNCTEWAPNVYFEDDTAVNLEAELARSKRIKCGCCGIKGAALGCYEMSCRRSFHVPCAKMTPQCRWDTENFVMLCPLHSSSKLPTQLSGTQRQGRKKSTPKLAMQAQVKTEHGLNTSRPWKWPHGLPSKWVLACSALTLVEKKIVSEFAKLAGVSLSCAWSPTVTHVIASTNENGACRRTLKFLMGIIEGKWILKIDWINACMKAMEPVDEEQYEIRVDIYGASDGPHLGRRRVMDKQPKLFSGLKFYFAGEFIPSYKGYLHDIVVAAGGTVLQRKPISKDEERLLNESSTPTFIIYSLEAPANGDSSSKALIISGRKAEAQTLANVTGAKVAGHTWILDSIAACKFSPFTD